MQAGLDAQITNGQGRPRIKTRGPQGRPDTHSPIRDRGRLLNETEEGAVRGYTGSPYTTYSAASKPARLLRKYPCPVHLGKKGERIWINMLDGLSVARVTPTILQQITAYVWLYLKWDQVRRQIDREGYLQEIEKDGEIDYQTHKLVPIMERLQHQCRAALSPILRVGTARQEVPLETRMAAVQEDVESKSSRGGLLGGKAGRGHAQ